MDAYVVHTNYDEYAILIMSKQKISGDNSTSVKLYSEWTNILCPRISSLMSIKKGLILGHEYILMKPIT